MKHLRLFEEFANEDITYLTYKYFEEIAIGKIKILEGSARVQNDEYLVTHNVGLGDDRIIPMFFSSRVKLKNRHIPATLIEFEISYNDESENIYRFCEYLKDKYNIDTGVWDETDDLAPGDVVDSVFISIMCVKHEDIETIAGDYITV